VLFDGRDRALYLFTRDRGKWRRCYGDCAVAWPPFYAKGRPRAGKGVDPGLLGTTMGRNGRRQVTYKGQPLYFYVDDPKAQVLCNDIAEFGGTLYALTAAGDPPAWNPAIVPRAPGAGHTMPPRWWTSTLARSS
jgi:hypothetical protein